MSELTAQRLQEQELQEIGQCYISLRDCREYTALEEDIPRLLSHIESLQSQLATERARVEEVMEEFEVLTSQLNHASDRIEELESERASWQERERVYREALFHVADEAERVIEIAAENNVDIYDQRLKVFCKEARAALAQTETKTDESK